MLFCHALADLALPFFGPCRHPLKASLGSTQPSCPWLFLESSQVAELLTWSGSVMDDHALEYLVLPFLEHCHHPLKALLGLLHSFYQGLETLPQEGVFRPWTWSGFVMVDW